MDAEKKEKRNRNKQSRKRWSPAGEEFLLDLWEKNMDKLRGARKNSHVYANIVAEMASQGYIYTPDEIKNKLHNITSRFSIIC
ncbi:uncharacterized protein [Musca autumnalis]|uniref:uncharacterized protein n=1 Tax=Musca autumnalis TaxID=221902 RepID=UPI003CFACA7B